MSTQRPTPVDIERPPPATLSSGQKSLIFFFILIIAFMLIAEEEIHGGVTVDEACWAFIFLGILWALIVWVYQSLKLRFSTWDDDRFPEKETMIRIVTEILEVTSSNVEVSKPITLTPRRDATLATILFIVDLKQRSQYRIVVFKGGDLSNESRKLLDHIGQSLHHQHGADYSTDGPSLRRLLTARSTILVYADPTIYRTHPGPHSGYGNRFMPTSSSRPPFVFGSLDGLLLRTSLSGERDKLIEICGDVVDNHMDWSRAVEGQEMGPQSHDDRIKPNKLSWLLMDSTTRHGDFLNSKYDHRRKRGHVPAVGQKRLVKAPEFLVLRNRFEKFLAENEQIVHRIKAKNMHGDCRAANWIWHYGGRRPRGSTPDRKYRVIDYANYMASTFKLSRLKERPLNRESTLQIKGEDGPEEITWIRPFILGRNETRPHTDDTLPDPLFDLAELIASLLLDPWVDPEENVEFEMSREYGGQTRRELIHEVFFEKGKKSRTALKLQFAYKGIMDATIPRVEKWIDSIDDSRRSRKRSGVKAKGSTKEWFRWAIADRLMYRACVISTNSEYDLLVADDDENGTPEIALSIAQKVLDFNEEQHKKSHEATDDLESYIQRAGSVVRGLSRVEIDASGNKGKQEFTVKQALTSKNGPRLWDEKKKKRKNTSAILSRWLLPLTRLSQNTIDRIADWDPGTKLWAKLDDGQFKFATLTSIERSSAGVFDELDIDITTYVTGSPDIVETHLTLPHTRLATRHKPTKSNTLLRHFDKEGVPRLYQHQTVYVEDIDRVSELPGFEVRDLPVSENQNISFGEITYFYHSLVPILTEHSIIVEVRMDHSNELRLYPIERLRVPDI